MKFLCLECNTAMQFKEANTADKGSMTAIFACPECFGEIAMYLNQWETQILKSLDVQLGGKSEAAPPMRMVRSFLNQKKPDMPAEADLPQSSPTSMTPGAEEGRCPFTAVVAEAFQPNRNPTDLVWTAEALERLERIPSFVQPMAKAGIETFARENGHTEITGQVMDKARGDFGM